MSYDIFIAGKRALNIRTLHETICAASFSKVTEYHCIFLAECMIKYLIYGIATFIPKMILHYTVEHSKQEGKDQESVQ